MQTPGESVDAPDAPVDAPVEEYRFPCSMCGSDLRYDPTNIQLTCDHCGNTEAIAGDGPWLGAGGLTELDFETAVRGALPNEAMEVTRVTNCHSCGAQVAFDPGLHAKECPFCATPLVADTGVNRHIKPRGVAPFLLDQAAAKEAMDSWLGRLWFAPNGLQEFARKGRPMDGIYVPYWTFDAQTNSSYSGERGTVYHETRTVVRDGKRMQQRVAKIRWTPARGRVSRFFDDVLVIASRSLPEGFARGLPPWDLAALQTYAPAYLAGFRAEAYTVDLKDAFGEARDEMDRVIQRDVRFDIGGDQQRVHQVQTEISDVTFKHVLLPIWMAAFKFRGKTYRCLVNGQTGRVQGERPYSGWKIFFAIVLVAILAAAVGYVIALNEGALPPPGGAFTPSPS